MIPGAETEFRVAFESALPWPWVVGLGVALVLLALGLCRRDAGISGRRGWTWTLLVLRLGAASATPPRTVSSKL